MKQVVIFLMSLVFAQAASAQSNAYKRSEISTALPSTNNYIAQVEPVFKFQANDAVVPPKEGKTEREKVWVNRGFWIALIAIIVIVYLKRRRKPKQ